MIITRRFALVSRQRASLRFGDTENGEWKFQHRREIRNPWNGERRDGASPWQGNYKWRKIIVGNRDHDNSYDPAPTLLKNNDGVLSTESTEFGPDKKALRGVLVKYIQKLHGKGVAVAIIC